MQKSTTARRADGPDKDWPGSRRKRTQCANVTAQLCVWAGFPLSLPSAMPRPLYTLPLPTVSYILQLSFHFLSLSLSLHLSLLSLHACLPVCPSVRPSLCPSLCLSACLSVFLPVCLLVSVSCPAFTSTIRACPEHPVSFCKVLMPCGNVETV